MVANSAPIFWIVWQRLLYALQAAIVLVHCAHPSGSTESVKPGKGSSVEWYIAQRDPLTYCPTGHKLPPPRAPYGSAPAYVYLADRSARFYIPPYAERHQEQALQLRQLSKSRTQGLPTGPPTVNGTIRWVGRALARTAVTGVWITGMMFGGVPQEGSIAEGMMEAVWEDDD